MRLDAALEPPDLDCMLRMLRGSILGCERGDLDGPGVDGFAAMARALYQERRRRDHYFSAELFAEPAWDMLLDLRVQADAPRHPSVSSACIGSTSPASTALRHLIALESEGLVERSIDPDDARRKLTRLTRKGAQLLDTYLAEVALNRASSGSV